MSHNHFNEYPADAYNPETGIDAEELEKLIKSLEHSDLKKQDQEFFENSEKIDSSMHDLCMSSK